MIDILYRGVSSAETGTAEWGPGSGGGLKIPPRLVCFFGFLFADVDLKKTSFFCFWGGGGGKLEVGGTERETLFSLGPNLMIHLTIIGSISPYLSHNKYLIFFFFLIFYFFFFLSLKKIQVQYDTLAGTQGASFEDIIIHT